MGDFLHIPQIGSYAAVAQAVERTKRRIAQSAATRKLYHGVAATFKLKT
jgi:hypothetical protein